eukprot:m.28882 g.28882  ORF g.28882 m.28882 type:complete len:101 (-) comp16000_c0_seq1:34-336(-)
MGSNVKRNRDACEASTQQEQKEAQTRVGVREVRSTNSTNWWENENCLHVLDADQIGGTTVVMKEFQKRTGQRLKTGWGERSKRNRKPSLNKQKPYVDKTG